MYLKLVLFVIDELCWLKLKYPFGIALGSRVLTIECNCVSSRVFVIWRFN